MKSTGIIINIDKKWRIGIPKELGVRDVPAKFSVVNNRIIIKKCNEEKCIITGRISRRNISLGNGIIKLHPQGVGKLIEILKQYLGKE